MSFSQSASLHVVPLLARIVLAAAFIPAGWNKLSQERTFEGEEAAILRSLGVRGSAPETGAPALPAPSADANGAPPRSSLAGGWSLLAAAPPAVTPPAEAPAEAPGRVVAPRTDGPGVGGRPAAPDASETRGELAVDPPLVISDEPLTAPSYHGVTVMVHRAGWPAPIYQAYAAVGLELIGGVLLLVGLFSRLWALGLAGVMVVAFWLTTWPVLAALDPFTALFNLSIADFNRLFCQAGLFVLAFGVALTGPGAASLDRAIFRPAQET